MRFFGFSLHMLGSFRILHSRLFIFFGFSSFSTIFSAFSFQNTKSFSFSIISRRSGSRDHNSVSSSSNTVVMDLYPVDDHFSLNRWAPQLALGEDISILFRSEGYLSHRARNGEVNLQNLKFYIFRFPLI
jgi:hypothetical protein